MAKLKSKSNHFQRTSSTLSKSPKLSESNNRSSLENYVLNPTATMNTMDFVIGKSVGKGKKKVPRKLFKLEKELKENEGD